MADPRVPEAAGPGVDAADGSVAFGTSAPGAQAVISPARPAGERDRDMAVRARNARRDRCRDIPDDIALAVVRAIRAAREGRPPQ
jgi:hypothetical protein